MARRGGGRRSRDISVPPRVQSRLVEPITRIAKKPKVRRASPDAPPRTGSQVQRLPSGRRPSNSRYAGRVYDGPQWTPELQQRYPDGVRFTDDGYPDFSPYARDTVRFEPRFDGNHGSDFTAANRAAGYGETPDGYIWHHHQDTQTMQLVPEDLHEAVRHAGGVAIVRGL